MNLLLPERFWAKVEQRGECWVWTAATRRGGYGAFALQLRRPESAHRLAYESMRDEIPKGLVLDHLCRNPSCVNPWHLEPVTDAVNIERGEGPSAKNAHKTSCHLGHPFSIENTYVDAEGFRHCRKCDQSRKRTRRSREITGSVQCPLGCGRSFGKKGDATTHVTLTHAARPAEDESMEAAS